MIFVTGDTHSKIDRFSHKKWEFGKKLNKKDYVIICGDFGLIWDTNESSNEESYWLKWLNDKNWTTLFVDGNHENFDRLNKFEEVNLFDGIVGKISDSIFHLKRGEVYTIENKKFFVMGGAQSIDKASRVEFISWWKEELPSHKEICNAIENLDKNNNEVDYILTHTPPAHIINNITKFNFSEDNYNLTKFFDELSAKIKFKKWYFGHLHIDLDIGNYISLYERIERII